MSRLLHQREEFNLQNARARAAGCSNLLPDIPIAERFQGPTSYFETPVTVHGWQWSTTFGRWSALLTFANGWHGFSYPAPE